MIKAAEIYLWGTRIGVVYQDEGDVAASFEYDKSFLGSGIELSPIKMPLSSKIYTFPELLRTTAFRGMPGLLADSLPDKFGNAVIDKWLISQGRKPDSFSAIERLCYTGKRGMGALEYVPANGPNDINDAVDVSEMVSLASQVLQSKQNISFSGNDITKMQLIEIGSSAGGARAKAVIAWNEQTGEIRSGQADAGSGFDYWLIKFDGVNGSGDHGIADGKQYTLIEYAYYLMAKDLNIDISECRILHKDGLNHFMTKRFDRRNGTKVHTQTLAALAHLDYNVPNLCSYELYAWYARQLGIGMSGIEQIFRRMAFAVIGVNCDDHVKNFSFLMDKQGQWRLAPAYDLTFAYNPDNRWISAHQMSINGKTKQINENDILSCGTSMGLNIAKCKNIIRQTKEVVGHWADYAAQCGISEKRAMEIWEIINK